PSDFIEVTDTLAPYQLQDVAFGGVSGAVAPAWDHSGGFTVDGSVTWADSTLLAPSFALILAGVFTFPFVEFPEPVINGGFELLTQVSDFGGFAVYASVPDWNSDIIMVADKSADSYSLDFALVPTGSEAPVPPVIRPSRLHVPQNVQLVRVALCV